MGDAGLAVSPNKKAAGVVSPTAVTDMCLTGSQLFPSRVFKTAAVSGSAISFSNMDSAEPASAPDAFSFP